MINSQFAALSLSPLCWQAACSVRQMLRFSTLVVLRPVLPGLGCVPLPCQMEPPSGDVEMRRLHIYCYGSFLHCKGLFLLFLSTCMLS